MPPLKPDVCLDGDRVALFIGADYKRLTLDQADSLIAKMQSLTSALRRKVKREKRKVERAA